MLTCKLGNEIINCYDGTYDKYQFKKWSSKNILICPVCGKPYEYCHGKVIPPYFRHKDKAECDSLYGEPETIEHINGKRDLFEWIKKQDGVTNVVIEGWIPETRQRPDIMFEYNGKKCVIEYQCTPIATEYIERHDLYKMCNIIDIWICGTKKYFGLDKRLNVLEKDSLMYYNSESKLFLKLEDLSEKEFKQIDKFSTLRRKYSNRKFYVMIGEDNYIDEKHVNYMLIKSGDKSYECIGCHYRSPSGRASRKYPYPIKDYGYKRNYSIARCYKIDNSELTKIDDDRRINLTNINNKEKL